MWAYETTFYQIYPLGFCGAPRENAAPVAEDELAQASQRVSNPDAPIMKSPSGPTTCRNSALALCSSTHRSNLIATATIHAACAISTVAWVGTPDFAAVCDTLHAHGIRVVLDAVFNHVGRGFGPSAMQECGLAVQGLVPH